MATIEKEKYWKESRRQRKKMKFDFREGKRCEGLSEGFAVFNSPQVNYSRACCGCQFTL